MPRPGKPKRSADQLDAALDGIGPGVVAAELLPLLEAADELRAMCARIELDPEVASRHLAQVLGPAGATVTGLAGAARAKGVREIAAKPRARLAAPPRSWRRRVAAFAVAAAVVLTPMVVLSTRTVPGDALYPVKLTVESARLTAAHWSADRTADERTHVASTRLDELDELVSTGQIERIPAAISALDKALGTAHRAVGSVTGQRDPARVAALDQRLSDLRAGRTAQLTSLVKRLPSSTPVAARVKIEGAVERSLSEDASH